MTIFSPLYSQIFVNEKKKDSSPPPLSFESKDLDSLECLRMTNESVAILINNFDSFKWKNNKYTNLLMLDFCTKNSNYKFLNNTVCCDSLYVNKNNNKDMVKAIYVTSHIIYYHYIDGYSIADILSRKIINVEKLCVIPKLVFRSFENKSIELIDEKTFKNNRYVTLKAFYDYYNNEKYNLEHIQTFLNNVFDVLVHNNLLPYFIHPQRLFLYEDDSIKLASPNLLQFILSPYFRYAKIQHSLFSHPTVLERNEDNSNKNKYAQRIITDSVDLFLDFFHSLFVTVLWIHNLNNGKAFDYIVRNEHSFFNNMTSIFMKNSKSTKINKSNFKEENFLNLQKNNNNNNNSNNINTCKYIHGFCLNYYDDSLRELIHNYGCHHLQVNMPLFLNNAMTQANDNNQQEIFLFGVRLEFEKFSNFLNQLKNI